MNAVVKALQERIHRDLPSFSTIEMAKLTVGTLKRGRGRWSGREIKGDDFDYKTTSVLGGTKLVLIDARMGKTHPILIFLSSDEDWSRSLDTVPRKIYEIPISSPKMQNLAGLNPYVDKIIQFNVESEPEVVTASALPAAATPEKVKPQHYGSW